MNNTTKPLVALDVSQMVYHGHGVGRYTEELARALLTHTNDQFDFTFYAGALRQKGFFRLRSRHSPWSRARWRLFTLPPKLAGSFFHATNLPLEWMIGNQDLVHLSDWTTPVTRAPSVTTVHDLVFLKYPETLPRAIIRAQTRRLARAVEHCTHFIADSESTKNDLVNAYSLAPELVTVVYPGVSEEFAPQKEKKIEQVKTKFKLPDQYLLALGTREPRKNLSRLIQAHQALAEKDPSIPDLVIAGRQGWGKDGDTSPRVHLTGFVPQLDLPALLSGATAFLYPSLYEGFGFPVLEAMACAAPVLTSNTSSLPEVAGKAAVMVDPLSTDSIGVGIREVLTRRKELVRLGLTHARRFSWENTARQTAAVYHHVLESKNANLA